MPVVEIQVGKQKRALEEATDEWVWTVIYQQRQVGLSPVFGISIQYGDFRLELGTPPCQVAQEKSAGGPLFEHNVLNIWYRMGLDSDDYTPGAAVCFMRHLRSMVEGRLQPELVL